MKAKQFKVLIVDDTAATLRNIKSILDSKYEVLLANSGKQALKFIPEKEPHVVLLDYKMPEMSGAEVFEAMKADETMKDIPVIFLTSVDDKKTIYSLLSLEPAGYLLKPVDQEKLFGTLQKVLASLPKDDN